MGELGLEGVSRRKRRSTTTRGERLSAPDLIERRSSSTPLVPTRSGMPTSPTSPPRKAGCTWPWSWTRWSRGIIGWSMRDTLEASRRETRPARTASAGSKDGTTSVAGTPASTTTAPQTTKRDTRRTEVFTRTRIGGEAPVDADQSALPQGALIGIENPTMQPQEVSTEPR